MNQSLLFANKLQYLPFRFLSRKWIRKWFAYRAGNESGAFRFGKDLADLQSKLIILPSKPVELFVMLPLVMDLVRKSDSEQLLLIAPEAHRPLFKTLGLTEFCRFYAPHNLRMGEPAFAELERFLRSRPWELALLLGSSFELPLLYLCRISGAPYRIGASSEDQYPFLNISLRPSNPDSAYAARATFRHHLKLPVSSKPLVSIHHEDHTHLSSSHVILLHLETPLGGSPWTPEEIQTLATKLPGPNRLLALATGKGLELYDKVLAKYQIRTAPLPSTSGALLEMLRQYMGVITLNSDHTHLFLNLSKIPVILLEDPSVPPIYQPEPSSNWKGFPRSQGYVREMVEFLEDRRRHLASTSQ